MDSTEAQKALTNTKKAQPTMAGVTESADNKGAKTSSLPSFSVIQIIQTLI